MIENLFDTHFHYYGKTPAEEYLARAHEVGVHYLMAVGADYEETKLARQLAGLDDHCWFTAGVHPHQAANFTDDISMFAEFANDPRMAAVGEIGLDYFYENSERDKQRRVMQNFLNWALEIGKPAIIHCRDRDGADDAYSEAYGMLTGFAKQNGTFVVHCYTGSRDWAERFLALGAYIGITGIVTFPKAGNVREVVAVVPPERLLLETDSPYLAPVPFRGKQNHPAHIPPIAEKVAEIKGIAPQKVADRTTENAMAFFRITHG